MRRAPRAPFEEVLVWKFSRFTRKREHAVAFKSMLRRRGVRVVSITEHADDSPTGKLMEAIIESVDEFYSENLFRWNGAFRVNPSGTRPGGGVCPCIPGIAPATLVHELLAYPPSRSPTVCAIAKVHHAPSEASDHQRQLMGTR